MTNVEGRTKQSVIRHIVTALERIYGPTIQRLNDLTRRSHSSFRVSAAFTLIELIVVTTVIIILTGLVLSTVGYVQKKGARARAETEIAAMSAACESYKADNGIYPTDASTTEQLNSTTSFNPTNYQSASLYLYKKLSGDTTGNRQPSSKSYMAFKPNMLLPAPPSTDTVIAIADPFGNSYGYSTMMAAAGTTSADVPKWIKNW